jgi:hypothetical protein
MQNMRSVVSAYKIKTWGFMWETRIFRRKRETVGRVAVDVKHRIDRLKALGNGQVPRVAATAWEILNHIRRDDG